MPFAEVNGHRCYYRLHGRDGDPPVILSHSLGLEHGMWDALTAQLVPHARVLRYDTRRAARRRNRVARRAPPTRRPATIPSSSWRATPSRSPTRWGSAGSRGAACRSAG